MLRRKRLGECLIEASVITERQLAETLLQQEGTNKRLGQILIEKGLGDGGRNFSGGVKSTACIDYVNVDDALISQDVVQLVPETLATKHNILPVLIQNTTLHLAMEDPLDINVIQHVEFQIGMQVKPLITLPSQLREAIRRHYNVEEYVGSLLENVPAEEAVSIEQEPDAVDVMNGVTDLRDLRELSEGSQVVKLVNMIVADGIKQRATDIHIEPSPKHITIRYRVDGVLTGNIPIARWLQLPMVSRIKVLAGMDISERHKPQDGRIGITYANRRINLRVSTLPSNFGEKVVIRVSDKQTSSHDLSHMGMSQRYLNLYRTMLQKPQGWILVTGPTGSGKTTTLYASLNAIKDITKSIVTVEDPIEYQLEGINQVQVNPKGGLTFASGLRSILRQDPDIILVGEIRDIETASVAMQAAETGHLVLSTLHTNDAISTVNRLFNLGIDPDLLASNLLAVVAQRLVRKICLQCKTEYIPDIEELRKVGLSESQANDVFWKGAGCKVCMNTGYYGRIGIYELFVPNDRLRDEIANRPAKHILKNLAIKAGMKTMLQDGIEKVLQGITTLEEIARVSPVEQDILESTLQDIENKQAIVTPPPGTTAQPVVQEQQIATQADVPEKPDRILIAEDDVRIRKTLKRLLKRRDYQVILAVDGEDALEKIRVERPDLVLLDIRMPKRDGFSVCQAMRSDVKTIFIPVIMLTALDSIEEKLHGLSVGADDYITKPFHPDELLARIEAVLFRSYQRETEGSGRTV